MRLYVGNLPYDTTEKALEELFGPHGAIRSVTIIKDRSTGQSKGFGFVEMSERSDGERAIAALDGQDFEGRKLHVDEARPMPEPAFRSAAVGGRRGAGSNSFSGRGR
jgi:RNA recognition motif-containing protein